MTKASSVPGLGRGRYDCEAMIDYQPICFSCTCRLDCRQGEKTRSDNAQTTILNTADETARLSSARAGPCFTLPQTFIYARTLCSQRPQLWAGSWCRSDRWPRNLPEMLAFHRSEVKSSLVDSLHQARDLLRGNFHPCCSPGSRWRRLVPSFVQTHLSLRLCAKT